MPFCPTTNKKGKISLLAVLSAHRPRLSIIQTPASGALYGPSYPYYKTREYVATPVMEPGDSVLSIRSFDDSSAIETSLPALAAAIL